MAERRLALIKLASLKSARNAERRGIVLDPKVCVAECTVVTNHMLVYNGYSPSMALTGTQPRDLHDIENVSVSAASGALETQLDFVENHIRARFFVKEAILESIVEDRLARAEKTKMQ